MHVVHCVKVWASAEDLRHVDVDGGKAASRTNLAVRRS